MSNELIGRKWGHLKKETREFLLENVVGINGVDCSICNDGKCIVDLTDNLSVSGEVINRKITVNYGSVIYNPEYGTEEAKSNTSFKIDEVMTVSEAAAEYNITEGTIRAAIKAKKFILGVDFRKAGRITLITKDAMERVYGEV